MIDRVCIFTVPSFVPPTDRPTVRRISSHAEIRPEANLIPSKRKTTVVSYKRRGLGISAPEKARKGKKKKKGKKRREEKGSWHAARGTRGSFSRRPGILHSLRLQEPQTRASIWASASRHLSLPRTPRAGSFPSPSRHHRPCSLPISLSSLLFSFSRFSSHSDLSLSRITDIVLLSLSFPAFFFYPRKWTKLRRRARFLCPTARILTNLSNL